MATLRVTRTTAPQRPPPRQGSLLAALAACASSPHLVAPRLHEFWILFLRRVQPKKPFEHEFCPARSGGASDFSNPGYATLTCMRPVKRSYPQLIVKRHGTGALTHFRC